MYYYNTYVLLVTMPAVTWCLPLIFFQHCWCDSTNTYFACRRWWHCTIPFGKKGPAFLVIFCVLENVCKMSLNWKMMLMAYLHKISHQESFENIKANLNIRKWPIMIYHLVTAVRDCTGHQAWRGCCVPGLLWRAQLWPQAYTQSPWSATHHQVSTCTSQWLCECSYVWL